MTKSQYDQLSNAPPHIIKQAEKINKIISEGRLHPDDLDKLIPKGVSPTAIEYWKLLINTKNTA